MTCPPDLVDTPSTPTAEFVAAVLHADALRLDAMLRADIDALDALLAPDCRYVHSNGRAQSKGEFLEALGSGAQRYLSLRYLGLPEVRACGPGTAVLSGGMQIEVAPADGTPLRLALLVTAVYVAPQGCWQLTAYHSTVSAPPTP